MWWKERREDTAEDAVAAAGRTGEGEAAKIARAATASGWSIIGLGPSVSLSELAVGFSFGVLRVPLVPALVPIALQALLVSVGGQWVGRRMGQKLGERVEHLAGPACAVLGRWLIAAQLVGMRF